MASTNADGAAGDVFFMKLCTTTNDLSAYASSSAETVRLFEGTGFKCLDFSFYLMNRPNSPLLSDDWMREIEDAAIAAEDIGVTFVQAHSPYGYFFTGGEEYERFIRSTVRSIEACKFLGVENIVIHPVYADNYGTPRLGRKGYMEANRRFLEEFFPVMEKTGVNLLIENTCETIMGLPPEESPGASEGLFYFAEDMLEVIDRLNHPLLHACWDTGHAALRGMDQYSAITTLGRHLRAVHIQDNFGQNDEHVAPFMGVLNLDEIINGLIDSGFTGYFTFEASHLLRQSGMWPIYRREWKRDTRLMHPPVDLARKGVAFMYEIGKAALSAYNLYEC